jgi:peroxiredoxin
VSIRPVPEPGDPAPDAELLDLWGEAALLSTAWADGPAVLVFLRYFGCPFCQMQVVGLRRDQGMFEESGASVTLVGQGPPEEAVAFRERRQVPFPVFVDPDRRAYRAYGLDRGRPSQVYGPKVAVPFVRANLTGKLQRGLHGGSFLQMPGSFVVDGAGILRFAHRNRTVADNPTNQALLDAVHRA